MVTVLCFRNSFYRKINGIGFDYKISDADLSHPFVFNDLNVTVDSFSTSNAYIADLIFYCHKSLGFIGLVIF